MPKSLRASAINWSHLRTENGLTRALPTKGGPNLDYLMWHAAVDPTRRFRLDGRLNESERE